MSEKYPIIVDDEYINNENDPCSVEEITEENSIAIEEEEIVIEADKVIAHVKKGRSDAAMKNHDQIMEEKVFDALKNGEIK